MRSAKALLEAVELSSMPRKNRSQRLLYVLCRLVEWSQVVTENEVDVALGLFLVMLSIESLGQKHVCTTYLDVPMMKRRLSGWYDFRWAISKMGFKSSPALLRPLELRHSRTTQMDGQEV